MVFKTRYLLLMALMILLINWINTTGEYILGSIVKEQASAMVAAGTARGLSEGADHRRFLRQVFLAGERDSACSFSCSSSHASSSIEA